MTDAIVLEALAAVLDVSLESIVVSANFLTYGGDSLTALRLSAECKRRGILVAVDVILASESISDILQQSLPLVAGAPTVPAVEAPTPSGSQVHPVACNNGIESLRAPIANYADISPPSSVIDYDSSRSSYEVITASTSPSPHLLANDSASSGPDAKAIKVGTVSASPDHLSEVYPASAESEELRGTHHDITTLAELSEGQISLIHGGVEVPGANIIHYFETYRPAQIPRMKQAWRHVLHIEPIFSARYRSPVDGCLIVPTMHWREFVVEQVPAYEAALSAVSNGNMPWQEASSGIDLAIRFTVVHLRAAPDGDCRSTLVWSVHHALIDGWSASQVLRKVHLAAWGQSVQAGPSFIDLSTALDDFRQAHKAEGDEFWAAQQERLATARDELLLPSPAGSSDDVNKNEIHIVMGRQYNLLRARARVCSVTPAAFFHAAWAVLLGLYTDSDNIVFGTVVSGRNLPLPGIFDTIGPMVNTLPLQIDIDWSCSVRDFVTGVFRHMQRLTRYSWTTPDNAFSRVVGSLMAMQPDASQHEEGGIEQIGQAFSRQTTNLPLSAIITDDGNIVLQYSSHCYSHNQISAVSTVLRNILIGLCNVDNKLENCAAGVLPTSTIGVLRSMGNCESSATTRSSITDDLVTLFERVARKHPTTVAIEHADRKVTYAELEEMSGRVAHAISALISPEEVVAVHADGSVNWLVSIYAVLRAGGTYCPLDQAHPQPYRESLFESSTARLFLATTKETLSLTPKSASSALDISAMVEGGAFTDSSHTCPLRARPRPWERAYLCFSSGTTGRPKGIICTHQGLVAFQRDVEVRLFATVGVRVAQMMSVAFDGSIHELFSALSYGATLVLRQKGDAYGHLKNVDSTILTPSIASILDPAEFPNLKTVYLVGEAVPQAVCNTWAAHKALYNMYGPTEATCGATIKKLRSDQPVTIGRPNPSTRIYILDHRRRFVPTERVGELYLAGVQVAQGYLGRPELNMERFLPDNICSGLGEFMFKTGDRGYWNEAGEIVFLGRVDRQIKLRGYRLDLEDLEARILKVCHGARAVALTQRGDDLACMIQTVVVDITSFRATIGKALPVYAVPRYITLADKLPVTPTGKVDYRAIADAAVGSNPREEHFKTKTEAIVAATWSRVLQGLPRGTTIGPHSNFTQLGGHSLQQLRVAAKLTAVFGERITVRMIMELATLRDLAGAIDSMTKGTTTFTTHSRSLGQYELSPMEKEWWQKYQLKRSSSAFNVSYVSQYDPKKIDQVKLIDAWNTTLARHDIFRSRYIEDYKHGLHRVLAPLPPRVEKVRSINVELELNRPFNLAVAPPVRVFITRNNIVATWSHIVCDYTTLGIFLNEVAAIYHRHPVAPTVQPYHQRVLVDGESPPCYLSFWSDYLQGVKASRPTYLGNDVERTSYRGTSVVSQLSSPFWKRMQARAVSSGITLQQLAVATVALAVTAADPDMDITLGTPFMNRQSEDDMHTVGLFLEPLPLRVAFTDQQSRRAIATADEHTDVAKQPIPESLKAYLSAVQASSQRSLSHAIPWHHLLEHLQIDAREHLPNHPLFDCVVSFHDARHDDTAPSADYQEAGPASMFAFGDGVEPQVVWSEGSKFKLMVELTAVDHDTLLLRLEYDTTCFESMERVAAARRMILRVMQAIVDGDVERQGSFVDLRRRLRAAWQAELASSFTEEGEHLETELCDCRRSFFQARFSELCASVNERL